MYRALVFVCFLGLAVVSAAPEPESIQANSVDEYNADRGGRIGGVASASRAVLGEIARELISRSTSSSQVLSLNLTNLVILLVLKAIIFGAGSMGLGWAGKGARSAVEDVPASPLVSEQEALLLLSFLMGDQRDGFQCLQRVACQEPEAANSYAKAGVLLSKGARMLQGVLPYDEKYDNIVSDLNDAVEYGRSGAQCDQKYTCNKS